VSISLTSSLEVTGRVVDDDGRAVARASVTVSEFVDDSGHVAQSAAPGWFRRRVEEVLTDDDGMFVVNALDHREYEWLAAHPQLGRALVITQPLVSMTIKVSAERRITGRVVKQGLPLAGVPVLILPLLDGLAESRDLLERIGQESQSDATGQFLVAVPSRFGGEVRIGSNSTGIVRRRFAAGTGRSVIDLGDIELGVRPTVEVHFDGRQNCDVAAVGPLGRVGMQVIAGIRNGGGSWRLQPPERGRWSIVVTCGNNVIAVEPSEFELRSEDIVLTVRIVSIER
jgi:hypothetical protein